MQISWLNELLKSMCNLIRIPFCHYTCSAFLKLWPQCMQGQMSIESDTAVKLTKVIEKYQMFISQ